MVNFKFNFLDKGGKTGGKSTGTAYVNTPSVLTDDYTFCNMCNRKYNENAYSKHLPTCERRAKESQIKNKPKPSGTMGMGGNTNSNTGSGYGNKPNLNVKFNKK